MLTYFYVNNETGIINDVGRASHIARENDYMFHMDAVQALGEIEFDIYDVDPDFASFFGHKVGSLESVGFLYADDVKKLEPFVGGCGQ